MSTSISLNLVNGSPFIYPVTVKTGFAVTGTLSPGQTGIVTLSENSFSIKKVVQADSHGNFSLGLTAGDLSHFGLGSLNIQLQSISTTVIPSLLQLFVNSPTGSMLYTVTGSTSEVLGVTDTFNANGDAYWHNNMQLSAVARDTVHIINFNSEDYIPGGFNFEDQRVTLNVGNATSVSFYINGDGGNNAAPAKGGNTEIDVYLGGLSTHGVTAPSFVITGDLGDVDGDNIQIIGNHYNFSVSYGSAPDSSVHFFNFL